MFLSHVLFALIHAYLSFSCVRNVVWCSCQSSVLCYWFSFVCFLIVHSHTLVCSHDVIHLCMNAVLNIVLIFLWVSCGKFDFCALPDLKICGTFMQ
jgi:hypothetical protein